MKLNYRDWWVWPGFGQVSLASFFLCAVSGIVIAIPYDADHALQSIRLFSLLNPFAVFFRNLHYWTAQLFFSTALIHAWQYFKPERVAIVRTGIWFRLAGSVLFLFYVMLSGFILKGDADSAQALQILRSLTRSIPFAGEMLNQFFLKDPALIYIHHVATATLILMVVIVEHARMIWSKASVGVLVFTGIISLILQPPLHAGPLEVMKGPWYFLGLQEILHYASSPAWILGFLFFFFSGLMVFQFTGQKGILIRRMVAVCLIIYLIFSLIAGFFRGAEWKWVFPWQDPSSLKNSLPSVAPLLADHSAADTLNLANVPMIKGNPESCLICHAGMQGLDRSHDPAALGCSVCHGGNAFTANAATAHQGMRLVPGNLQDAALSCGQTDCHPDIPARMNQSLMHTLSGMIGVNRWVFGEAPNPDIPAHVANLTDSPADMHLRNLCAGCHLGQQKVMPGTKPAHFKGGGCLACHLRYQPDHLVRVDRYYAANGKSTGLPKVHAGFSAKVGNDQCFDCHNRSGRIATNYEGWYESLDPKAKPAAGKAFRIVDGYRVFYKASADVHHTAGLSCTDCHGSAEVMGYGRPAHKEQAVYLECEDCHNVPAKLRQKSGSPDTETRKLLQLNPALDQSGPWLTTRKGGFILNNTSQDADSGFSLIGKISGKRHRMKEPLPVCREGFGHSRLSCQSCHTAWAPTCLGCHTTYDQRKAGFDHLKNRPVSGTWTELAGEFGKRPPSLGVREEAGGKSRITTFVPGMIMTLDTNSYQGKGEKRAKFVRLYAPADPHTTLRNARGCKDCHLNPLALGYGEGNLEYSVRGGRGHWKFSPAFEALSQDGLPADAWIGFLREPAKPNTTRTDYRAFSLAEQRKILKVGTCLSCHAENSRIVKRLVVDYQRYIQHLPATCICGGW